MKPSGHKKLLGLALGDKSLLVAEVAAGQRPQVKRLAEFVYPSGLTPQTPLELGVALGKFLKENGFSTKPTIIGIPVKWLLVRAKEVPNSDAKTLASLLRLQAETEFTSELKDLVYEYAEGQTNGPTKTVMLLATQQKNIDNAQEICEGAKLNLLAITPSAVALGQTTGAAMKNKEVLVLSLAAGGSELTAQQGLASNAIRHLRAAEPRPPFVSELRRAVSTMPATGTGSGRREMVMWDGTGLESGNGKDAGSLSEQLGFPVRFADLPALGVDTAAAGANGDGRKYAAAVSLAVAGMTQSPVDFLHSRLAPPKERRLPKWAVESALAALVLIGAAVYGYTNLQAQQDELQKLQDQLNDPDKKEQVAQAQKFVDMVTIARNYHHQAGKPQPEFLACFRDLTEAIPVDGVTYATSLTIKDAASTPGSSSSSGPKKSEVHLLTGTLDGKTSDQGRAITVSDDLLRNPAFTEVHLGNITNIPRERQVAFSVDFKYDPSKAAP